MLWLRLLSWLPSWNGFGVFESSLLSPFSNHVGAAVARLCACSFFTVNPIVDQIFANMFGQQPSFGGESVRSTAQSFLPRSHPMNSSCVSFVQASGKLSPSPPLVHQQHLRLSEAHQPSVHRCGQAAVASQCCCVAGPSQPIPAAAPRLARYILSTSSSIIVKAVIVGQRACD